MDALPTSRHRYAAAPANSSAAAADISAPSTDAAQQVQSNEATANDSELLMPYDVTNEVSASGRIELYRSKPCLFVTTRILVVDMLNARIQGQHIAGMVIMNAHRVTDSSGEAFAVRLFRMANKHGFVRAFSDQPTGFASGFNKVRSPLSAVNLHCSRHMFCMSQVAALQSPQYR